MHGKYSAPCTVQTGGGQGLNFINQFVEQTMWMFGVGRLDENGVMTVLPKGIRVIVWWMGN